MMNTRNGYGVPADALERLTDFFPADDLEFRIGATSTRGDETRGMALVYVTNRAIMERLDAVCGPANWRNEYRPSPNDPEGTSVLCGISILVQRGESADWVTKWDGAENSNQDPVKGGLSTSMKRAGYQWGIGRYLYRMPSPWVAVEKRGKSFVMKERPRVPAEFLPKNAPNEVPEPHPDDDPGEAPARPRAARERKATPNKGKSGSGRQNPAQDAEAAMITEVEEAIDRGIFPDPDAQRKARRWVDRARSGEISSALIRAQRDRSRAKLAELEAQAEA